MAKQYPFIPYQPLEISPEEALKRAEEFYLLMNKRRTIRDFSDQPVPKELMEKIILTASTAPSGANKQPWTFALVGDPEIKKKIRVAAEKEEYENYHNRMSEEWLEDLAPLMTDWKKGFLEVAPWLIVVFKRVNELVDGKTKKNYYVNESVGLAAGMLLAAIHNAGLVSLTHTPSPMNFLTDVLDRPENERAVLLIPVGYPDADAKVPDIGRKSLDEILVEY